MHQSDAAAPPGARLPLCLQHGGVGVGVVAEQAMAGQPQEHLGWSVVTLTITYTVHCTLYHALQDVMLPPGARYHKAAPILATAAEPDLGHEARECSSVEPRMSVCLCHKVLARVLSVPHHRPEDGPPAAGVTPSR